MKRITFVASILLLITLLALSATAFADDEVPVLEIQVSPHTLNLASNGGYFSIHAVVAYSTVDDVALTVNGVDLNVKHTGVVGGDAPLPDCHTFDDDRGELVVKCDLDTIKGMVTEGEATFALGVVLTDGTELAGEETIEVVNHGHDEGGNGGHGDGECDGDGQHGPGGKR